jgi:hypothetical protein
MFAMPIFAMPIFALTNFALTNFALTNYAMTIVSGFYLAPLPIFAAKSRAIPTFILASRLGENLRAIPQSLEPSSPTPTSTTL